MKTTLVIVLWATVFSAFGSADVIIRERAKELRNQSNVRQGVPPPTQPAQPAAPGSGPAAPAQSPAVSRLSADLAAFQANAVPTPAQKQRLAQSFSLLGSRTNTLAAASKLAESVAAASAEKPLSPTSRARFVQDMDALLNPGKYPQAKPDGIYADIQAIFQENGLQRTRAVAIVNEVKGLVAETRR